MSLDLSTINDAPRILIEAELQPLQGTRFQPTGFPDIGAAQYEGPDGTQMLLVESPQSMANRMEAVCWDTIADDWVPPLKGLPVVKVVDEDGQPLTNSVLEAHRLNSEYIARTDDFEPIKAAINHQKDRPFSIRDQLAPVLLDFDINSLIHGIFLEEIAGVIRLPRALSAFIEASKVAVASSGGVKKGIEPGKKGGEGNVIFSRDEFVSPDIRGYFSIDLAQFRSYGFSEHVYQLLVALTLYKIRAFLETGLRLRTACDLELMNIIVKQPNGFALPELSELDASLPNLIEAARPDANFQATTVTYRTGGKSKKKEGNKNQKEASPNANDED
ncbi:MAG: type I-U CRISPR-associated RAMP protein Csb1/Cas7u [Actinomycetota bacterium]|jgi:CRISPR-associated protein Csb1|nr:type I-U CRISPR-associated RAMP protein Csb1/Cas7u [Actinomycetota bacterium]MCL6094204.1 type I-U CRISPR-associated RAMP protein Csb1/Cas7u [Actinomycetota bacterium]MDA8167452.1 type I-U CRISPR-associated RAMP protein Csb1/Cas7u [Actinomycetota bacterium]